MTPVIRRPIRGRRPASFPMRGSTRSSVAVVALLVAASVGSAQPREARENAAQPSEFYHSSAALLRIHFPDPALALNHAAIEVLLTGAAVMDRAIDAAFGNTGDEQPRGVEAGFRIPEGGEFSLVTAADGVTLTGIVTVTARFGREVPRARLDELIRRIAEQLAAALPTLSEAERAGLAREQAALRERIAELHERQVSVAKSGEELKAQAGEIDITNLEHVFGMLTKLQEQRAVLEQEQVAMEVRRAALMKQVAGVRQQVDEAVTRNVAVAELSRIVTLREQKLDRQMKLREKAMVSEVEVLQTQEELALARADLARQRQQAVEAVGGGLLAKLNDELVMLAVQFEETAARLSHTRDQFTRYLAARERATRFDQVVRGELHALSDETGRAAAREREIAERLKRAASRPTVTLLGQAAAEPESPK